MDYKLHHGDCLDVLPTLEKQSIQCVVTSPPYFGLRDYGNDAQIGLESSPAEYVTKMVAVFRQVWRVLADDGTCWLNLGDSYVSNNSAQVIQTKDINSQDLRSSTNFYSRPMSDLPSKNLLGIPWRVAFALQDDGWYLRSDIIWHKPNPMPESVTDRPTKAHEYVFLLTKNARYYYDHEAIKEPSVYPDDNRKARQSQDVYDGVTVNGKQVRSAINPSNPKTYPTRNKRSVWTIEEPRYRLKKDLTPEQRRYVLQRIADEDSLWSYGNSESNT